MDISVFGLGYVGAVSAACLASEGHRVVGVDTNLLKVDLIGAGRPPIIERDLDRLIADAVAKGRLTATTSAADAVGDTDMSFICVGTPSNGNGSLDLSYVRRVCEEIGAALRSKADFHVVVLRSTVLPGTMREVVLPVLERQSGRKAGTDFGVCNNPEFLREGSAIADFYNPPKTVIGETDGRSGAQVAALYKGISAPLIRTDIETAEMVKYADNAWHAIKVCFANEIGNVCKALGIDGQRVMEIFCKDRKLNISSCYLRPGFAFGGSCLPKDVRALTYRARMLDVDLPLLNAVLPSNDRQIERAFRLVSAAGRRRIGVLGISFKAGTDDLRESPMVELVERLIGKGFDLRIYDRNVKLASLVGANKDFILNRIPHISRLLEDSVEAVLAHGETIVIGNSDPEFGAALERLDGGKHVVDLVRVADRNPGDGSYEGICW